MMLTDFFAARRIPLVGRQELLQDAERRIRRGGTHLLYFEGEGGIGKTALIEAILEGSQARKQDGGLFARSIAREVVDLYHMDVHTPEGLIRRVVEVLGSSGFEGTRQALKDLDRARSMGNVDLARERAAALQEAFLEELVALAGDGVVLAFDTIEVLEYEHDPFEMELGAEMPGLGTREWLFTSLLPALRGHIVLLLAGRPSELGQRLQGAPGENPFLQLQVQRLQALDLDEVRSYLGTVAQAEEDRGDSDAAERLWGFCQERAEIVHLLTGGRPILLALVADMVAHGWALPPAFGRTLEELQQRGAESWWPEIEWALVVRIQESPSPIGDTIRALAWLRKGATPQLLARVMSLGRAEDGWDLETVQQHLEQAAQLALVKVRPNEGRVFLHDEMYALLDHYVLQQCSSEERERVYESVLEYYRDQLIDLEERIEQVSGLSPLLHAEQRQAYIEEMHYRLRHHPAMGYAYYFWRAEEASGILDTELDMLLRAELFRTVGLLRSLGPLPGLDLDEMEVDTAVRWGIRALFVLNDPQGALDILSRIRERWRRQAPDLGLAWAHLQLYSAVARILRAEDDDWQRARTLLKEVKTQTDAVLAGSPDPPGSRGLLSWLRAPHAPPEAQALEGQRWRARILQALALNYQGYLDRQQGRYRGAAHRYQASAMLQRRLGMAGLSSVLINLSYALALVGECHHARLVTEEAERWARRLGQEYVLALALNARALVEEYDGHPQTALDYTDQALGIARGLSASRVRGLIYLTRARAHRHLMEDHARKEIPGQQFFDDPLKDANQAVNLLKNNPPDRVMALIERGCIYREMARWHYGHQDQVAAVKATRSSQRDLERTVALAGAMDLAEQQALAWTHLARLWYYAGQIQDTEQALDQASACIPADYSFVAGGPLPAMAHEQRKEEARSPFWNTLGQVEMLRAHIALDGALAMGDPEAREQHLKAAVQHISYALAYLAQTADEHFDLVRAEEGLHGRLLEDRLNIGTLHQHARQVAEEQGLAQPSRFQEFLDRMFGPAELWA